MFKIEKHQVDYPINLLVAKYLDFVSYSVSETYILHSEDADICINSLFKLSKKIKNMLESLLLWTFIFMVSKPKLFLLGLVLFRPGCAPRGPRVLLGEVRGGDLQVRARGLQLHGGGRGQGAVQ